VGDFAQNVILMPCPNGGVDPGFADVCLRHYRVLHNSLPFSFPKIFMWSCLLWLSVTVSLSAVQRT
jgi:hypothetical protein